MILGAPASDPDKSAAIVEQLDTGDNKDLETAEWWGWGGWGWGGPWGGWGGPWGGWGGKYFIIYYYFIFLQPYYE